MGMKNGKITKGGWRMDAPPYQSAVRRFLVAEIENRRPLIILPEEAERGSRFNSNDSVVARVESNYTEEEFMACPGLAVDAMLIDAASSDFSYSHEKAWMDERQSRDGYGESDEEGYDSDDE